MNVSKPIYRLVLAALLLGSMLLSASPVASVAGTRYAAASVLPADTEHDGMVLEERDAHDALFHSARQLSVGNGPGGAHGTGKSYFIVPELIAAEERCSKSVLRHRLFCLLEHFQYPQRLSLFPKHWFW